MFLSQHAQDLLATGSFTMGWLFWADVRDRSDDSRQGFGFWTGPDVQDFTIGGTARTYYGAGGLMQIPPLQYEVGLVVQQYRIRLAITTPEVEAAIRGYDAQNAPAELHLALWDPADGSLASIDRAVKGHIAEAPIREDAIGGETYCEAIVVSSASRGTDTLSAKKSDASQRKRDETDAGRQYGDVSAAVNVVWGGEKSDNYWVSRPD